MAEKVKKGYRSLELCFVRVWLSIIGSVLTFAGVGGCDSSPYPGDFVSKYGSPYSTLTVSGTVTSSATAQPIEGIQITVTETGEAGVYPADPVFTDAQGKYSFSIDHYPYDDVSADVSVQDVDGAANGSFSDKTVSLTAEASETQEQLDITLDPSASADAK